MTTNFKKIFNQNTSVEEAQEIIDSLTIPETLELIPETIKELEYEIENSTDSEHIEYARSLIRNLQLLVLLYKDYGNV